MANNQDFLVNELHFDEDTFQRVQVILSGRNRRQANPSADPAMAIELLHMPQFYQPGNPQATEWQINIIEMRQQFAIPASINRISALIINKIYPI